MFNFSPVIIAAAVVVVVFADDTCERRPTLRYRTRSVLRIWSCTRRRFRKNLNKVDSVPILDHWWANLFDSSCRNPNR